MTGIPHRCPWCIERCDCGAEPAAIEECTHGCDAIDETGNYTAADISACVPDEFPGDDECDFTQDDVIT